MCKKIYKKINKCRVCSCSELVEILTLGDLYVSNFFDTDDNNLGLMAPLKLVICDKDKGGCGLVQLLHTVSADEMYRNYWYRSGINETMSQELSGIAIEATRIVGLKKGDYVIDIGANDGTLLRGYSNELEINTIGFEPANNLQKFNKIGTTNIISEFFSFNEWKRKYKNHKAKVITAIGMFYDLDDPNAFVSDVTKCLDDNGVFIIQMMYLPYFLERNAFDGICHEHLEYYSISSLEALLDRHDLEIFDLKMREEINEGSLRIFIRKCNKGKKLNILEDSNTRLKQFSINEKILGLDNKKTYLNFVERVISTKLKVIQFLQKEVSKGKIIHGYAASTKGNTTLQFYGIDKSLINIIADRNPTKYGKYTAGSLIPICSEETSRAMQPDFYFILAWHFLPDFIIREKEYLKKGGKFIVPMPEFKIISYKDIDN